MKDAKVKWYLKTAIEEFCQLFQLPSVHNSSNAYKCFAPCIDMASSIRKNQKSY